MKIASYNISGGFYIGNEETEYLDREAVDSFDDRLLSQLIELVNTEQIDVICLQEVITTKEVGYIEKIKENTDLKYSYEFELSPCNIVKSTDCGVAILSRYEIVGTKTKLFPNPKLSKTTSSGQTYYTYDKGLLSCEIMVGDRKYKVMTHHGFPYRRFNAAAHDNLEVFRFFDEEIDKEKPDFITGDFNTEDFMDLMKYTRTHYWKMFDEPTTVDGCKFDNILMKKNEGFDCELKIVESTCSDHFALIVDTRL